MFGIIGGSGFENFEGFKTIEGLDPSTPFGEASSGLKRVSLHGQECVFLSRHGEHHELLPSEVNYRANIFALKKQGVKALISFSAVGSLREELKPGDLVISNQYIDRTKGLREHSFSGHGFVSHVSLAEPIPTQVCSGLKKISSRWSWDTHFDQTYVCIEGPNFSTRAESHNYRSMEADIIGMTHFPEFALAREAGLSYLPCCFVTDYDCWNEARPHVTLDEVIGVMKSNNKKAFEMLRDILALGESHWWSKEVGELGLRTGLMTPMERIPVKKKAWLEVLLDNSSL